MRTVAVTGGIGSGKSAVCAILSPRSSNYSLDIELPMPANHAIFKHVNRLDVTLSLIHISCIIMKTGLPRRSISMSCEDCKMYITIRLSLIHISLVLDINCSVNFTFIVLIYVYCLFALFFDPQKYKGDDGKD